MKYRNTGFRSFYHAYIAVPVTEDLRKTIRQFPGAGEAGYVLTYGYIDRVAGMTLEVLASADKTSHRFRFWDTNLEAAARIRVGAVQDAECYHLDDDERKLYGWYRGKIDALAAYDATDDVEQSRQMTFLDASRQPLYPDDVLVWLHKDGCHAEGCWVQIDALDDKNHVFFGTLLNEPDQDFGCHEGDRISFFVHQRKNRQYVLYADWNRIDNIPPLYSTQDMTLEEAIRAYYREPSMENAETVLQILSNSTILIPCETKLSAEDQEAFLELLEEKGKTLTGETVISQGPIRLVPDIFQKGGEYFYPVFSAETAMVGDYGKQFSIVEKPFLEILPMVQHHPKRLAGIVVNPMTQPFVVPMELVDWVMK
ncbi:MAG: SseB domain-containing protein [Succiniclasticum sp.]